jgi:hypothetical protein
LLTRSLEPLGIPAFTSSSPLIECDLGGTVGPDGEVDRRSTRFLGRIPSFATSQPPSLAFVRGTYLDRSFQLYSSLDYLPLDSFYHRSGFLIGSSVGRLGHLILAIYQSGEHTISIPRLPPSRTRSSHRPSLRLSRSTASRFRIEALGYGSIITIVSAALSRRDIPLPHPLTCSTPASTWC